MSDSILQQQIEYYRARASEYDEWFYRQGRYDRGEDNTRQWFEEVETVRTSLLNAPQIENALELACGTGIWTQELIKIANHVTALDASPEMIAINQAKVQSDKVSYQQVDLFTWQAQENYDMIFFSFWLSHVPADKLSSFLEMVASALKPHGRLFILDSRRETTSTASNHVLPDEGQILKRKLNDGREYEIVKIFYEPDALATELKSHGLTADVRLTPNYFIYADGQKAP